MSKPLLSCAPSCDISMYIHFTKSDFPHSVPIELSGYIYPVQSLKAGVKALTVALSWHSNCTKWG